MRKSKKQNTTKLSIWERTQLHRILSDTRLSGGITFGELDMALELKLKLEYTGEQEDDSVDTELELSAKEVSLLKERAFRLTWPISERSLQLRERLEQYSATQKTENNE